MAFNWAPYQAATRCASGPKPGTVALDLFIEEMIPETRFGNIFACRDIVGGTGRSHHAEGRATDRMHGSRSPSIGFEIVELLGPFGRELGIDHMICNLMPWSTGRGLPRIFAAPYPQGKVYTGTHPHKDHNHGGLTRAAAAKLTLSTIRAVVLGTPAPPPPPQPEIDDMYAPCSQGDSGVHVEAWQRVIQRIAAKQGRMFKPDAWGKFDAKTSTELQRLTGPGTNIGPSEGAVLFELLGK